MHKRSMLGPGKARGPSVIQVAILQSFATVY